MPFERGRRSQYRIEAGTACVLGDLLARRQVVADQLAFEDSEGLAHAGVGQIENLQPADARSTNTPNDFQW